jgi:glycosyltransferase involved in cell wall biosynthesis
LSSQTSTRNDASQQGAKRRFCIVTPRYGEGVVGGSELVMTQIGKGLAERGATVEVATTCARDHYTWANELPEGVSSDGPITVRRFATEKPRSSGRFRALQERIHNEDELRLGDELAWVESRFRVPGLYRWLGTEGERFDAILLSPYLFWTTIFGSALHPERSVIVPCLHDEAEAQLQIVSAMLTRSAGVLFLSEPEHQLGHRISNLPRHEVIGAAVEPVDSYDPDGFRARHGLERPFVLYAGRREDGKGWRALVNAFGAAVLRHDIPFDLVTVGVGVPYIPDAVSDRVIDIGYLEDKELPHAFAAAEAYLQPSPNESFSRTVMEAWMAGTPVVATSASEVVSWHCERSGAGLIYGDSFELAQCLLYLANSPRAARALAGRGRAYVLTNYQWPLVIDKVEAFLAPMLHASTDGGAGR